MRRKVVPARASAGSTQAGAGLSARRGPGPALLAFVAGTALLCTLAVYREVTTTGRSAMVPRAVASANVSGGPAGAARTPSAAERVPDRVVGVGETALLPSYEVTVQRTQFETVASPGYLLADVRVENTGERAVSVTSSMWTVRTPDGRSLGPVETPISSLPSGLVEPGAATSGLIAFAIGAVRGDFEVLFSPFAFHDARAIWQVPPE